MGMRFPYVFRAVIEITARTPTQTALACIAFHFCVSWAVFYMLDESPAAGFIDMFYYYVVTGSSVGYGDMSAQTQFGRLFTGVWVIPGALAGLAWLIGKIILMSSSSRRKILNGTADFTHRANHAVIIGYVQGETERLISQLLGFQDERQKNVIISAVSLEGRVPQDTDWVFSTDLADVAAMRRAGISSASKVMIMTGHDDTTLTTCLSLASQMREQKAVALFQDAKKAGLLRGNCPNIEAVVSPGAALLARAVDGPGTGSVIENLLCAHTDDTLAHAVWDGPPMTVGMIRDFMDDAGCLLIAVGKNEGPDLVPAKTRLVETGENLYYIGKESFKTFSTQGGRS